MSVNDALDNYERREWAQEQSEAIVGGVQQESIVPYWLEPIGDSGFYVTPNEPVDPWDCDRYRNSPWCGGSGVDPIDLVTLQPASATPIFSTNQDLSEFCVDIGINLFAVALPSYTACYRAPWARPLNRTPPPSRKPETSEWHTFDFAGDLPGGLECDYFVGIDLFLYNQVVKTEIRTKGIPIGWYTERDDSPYFPSSVPEKLIVVSQTTSRFSSNPGNLRYVDVYGYPYSYAIMSVSLPNGEVRLSSCPPGPRTPYTPPKTYSLPPNLPSEPMSCCNTAEIEEMLRVIMLRLGTTNYPVDVPKSLVDDSKDTEAQQSLTELLFWTIKQMDALAGQFPIDIEIKDADPSQEGDQARKVTIPNIAEGIAELLGLNIRTSVNSDIHTSFLMRLAAEIIATKNASLVTQDYAKANASYLGYKGNTVKRKVNYSFNATNLDTLDKILEETEKEIVGWQDEDKNTVQDYLEKLMFAAGIIKQTFFRPNSDKDKLLDQISNVLGVKDQGDNSDDSEEKGWKEFLKAINDPEGGFNRNSPTTPKVIDPSDISKIDVKYRSSGDSTIQATGGP